MFVTGIAAFVKRRNNDPMNIIPSVMKRDLRFFIVVYAVAILASFLPAMPLKIIVAVFLVCAYTLYLYKTLRSSIGKAGADGEGPGSLYLMRKNPDPPLPIVILQIAIALAIIMIGAFIFVGAVQVVAVALGVPVLILSLIITPIATELPEKFNSIIWVSRGKDTLALGNITGAMVFQSSLIPAIGILLTDWVLEPIALTSAALALIAVIFQYIALSGKNGLKPAHLVVGVLFYMVFIGVLIL